jgi:hypothetical protein
MYFIDILVKWWMIFNFLLYKFIRIYEILFVNNCVLFPKLRSSFLIILDGISFTLFSEIFRTILLLTDTDISARGMFRRWITLIYIIHKFTSIKLIL